MTTLYLRAPGSEPPATYKWVRQTLIQNTALNEISGIVRSHLDSTVLWVHEDSVGSNKPWPNPPIYAIKADGSYVGDWTLQGATVYDMEDIAIADVGATPYIYLGDVGTSSVRQTVFVYRWAEPVATPGSHNITVFDTIRLKWPVYPPNCEAMYVDATHVYLVTVTGTIYRGLISAGLNGPTADLQEIGTFSPGGIISGADLAPTGHRAIRTWTTAYIWAPGASDPSIVQLEPEPQGEAIALDLDGEGFVTTTEVGSSGTNPPMNFYEKVVNRQVLGEAIFENMAFQQRKVMAWCTIPLKDSDGYQIGMPITAVGTGTGQDERCQVEQWGRPYASGNQRCVRLTFPILIASRDREHKVQFELGDHGVLPNFTVRSNVAASLVQLQLRFTAGPTSTHTVTLYPGPATETYNGTRSRVYRMFGRIYNATVQTQLWAEVDIEIYSDMDYCEFVFRWGCSDPRIDARHHDFGAFPNDREVALWIKGPKWMVEPALRNRDVCVRSLTYDDPTGEWKWLIDEARVYTQHGKTEDLPANVMMGNCQMNMAVGYLLCGNPNGLFGDQVRDDTFESLRSEPRHHFGMATTWREKQEAFWTSHLARAPKPHEHWRGFNWNQQRAMVRGEIDGFYYDYAKDGKGRPVLHPFAVWTGRRPQSLPLPEMQASGNVSTFGSNLLWHGMIYETTTQLWSLERTHLQYGGYPCWHRDADGTVFRVANHYGCYLYRGFPFWLIGGVKAPDTLGKTLSSTQSYYSSREACEPADGYGGRFTQIDMQHWEDAVTASWCMVSGSRAAAWMVDCLLDIFCGMYPMFPGQHRIEAVRAMGRMLLTMSSLCAAVPWERPDIWSHLDQWWDAYAGWERNVIKGQYPTAIIEPLHISGTTSQASGLLYYDHWRPWETVECAESFHLLPQILGSRIPTTGPSMTAQIHRSVRSAFKYGVAMVTDGDGGIQWIWPGRNCTGPGCVAGPGVGTALAWLYGGAQKLTIADLEDQNPENGQPGTNPSGNYGKVVWSTYQDTWAAPAKQAFVFNGLFWDDDDRDAFPYVYNSRQGTAVDWPGKPSDGTAWKWSEEMSQSGAFAYDPMTPGTVATRGTISGVTGITGIAASQAYPGEYWFVCDGLSGAGASLFRARLSDGAITATHTVTGATNVDWQDVCMFTRRGVDYVAIADIGTQAGSGSTFTVYIVTEAAPTVLVQTFAFQYGDSNRRMGRGLAYHPATDELLVLSQATALWALPWGGTSAPKELGRILFNTDTTQTFAIDVSADGKDMVIAKSGELLLYRWNGKFWGMELARKDVGYTANSTAWDRNERDDDARRLVYLQGLVFKEIPI